MELAHCQDILITTHQAVWQCIYADFMKKHQSRSLG